MNATKTLTAFAALMLAIGLAAGPALAQHGTEGEWHYYGGDIGSTRYAPLDQINKDNFKDLKVAWMADSPDVYISKTEADGTWRTDVSTISGVLQRETPRLYRTPPPRAGSLKATAIMAEGLLFLTTPIYQTAAFNARTGKMVWCFNPKSYEAGTPPSMTWNARGCAYWTDGTDSRILWGTGEGYLMCVDAKTGRPCADFAEKGRLDLTVGIPNAERGTRDEKNELMYSMSSPPLIIGDIAVCGSAITDGRTTKENPAGWVRGFDVRTGKLAWTFHTVPLPGEFGSETWEDGANAFTGNTNVWTEMSGDADLGYVYLPLSTPSCDYYGGHRPGDNLFAESVVCLDAKTGKRIWHFQAVHHGMWDYDFPSPPILLDVNVDGKPRKILAQLSKQGFVYVFDRVTGVPIWPIVEKPVPTEPHIPGEKPSPTQPHPTKPLPVSGQGTLEDQVIDFTPELHKQAMEILSHYVTGPLFTPPTLADANGKYGTIQRPSLSGSTTWPGGCADPTSGFLFVPSRDNVGIVYYRSPSKAQGGTVDYMNGGMKPQGIPNLSGPQGLPLWKPPYSRMTAINLNSGDNAWMRPSGMGQARIRNHPALAGMDLPPLGGESRGGPIVTKTLMISAKGGSSAGYGGETQEAENVGPGLVAYDKVTGAEVAFASLPASPVGVPMTYMHEGKQYIGITVSGNPPKLVTLALPSDGEGGGRNATGAGGGGGRGGRGAAGGGRGGRGGGGGGRGGRGGAPAAPGGARGAAPAGGAPSAD